MQKTTDYMMLRLGNYLEVSAQGVLGITVTAGVVLLLVLAGYLKRPL